MNTLYLDLASNRFPGQGQDATDNIHCTRVAAMLGNHPPLIALIRPHGWSVQDSVAPYLKANDHELSEGMDAIDAAHALAQLYARADNVAAFNAPFHQRVFMALFIDAQREIPTGLPWRCLMDLSAPIVKTKLVSAGKWKSPRLMEAFNHFAGVPLTVQPEWDKHALQQVIALRNIDAGLRRHGEAA